MARAGPRDCDLSRRRAGGTILGWLTATIAAVTARTVRADENSGTSLRHQPGQSAFRAIRADELVWQPFPAFPPAARLSVLVGNPAEAGPYVIRVHLPHGTRMMPHRHPEDRVYTVISGVFYIGLGEQFDVRRLEAYAPGTVIVLPGNQPHFHWARSGDYVTQVTALGPLGLTYVRAGDDPRRPAQVPSIEGKGS